MSYYNRNHSNSSNGSFIALAILLIIVLLFIRSCASSTTYNKGICPYCRGHYVFQQAVGHRSWTNYLYKCDQCGRMIETAEYYPEVNNETITK